MPAPGYVTPSRIKDMMTGGRRKGVEFGKTAHSYAQELALERIGIEVPDTAYGNAIDWGNEWEYLAIEEYEKANFCEVHSQQVFQVHPDYEWVGGTPDGLVGEDGGMDAKCPYNITNHMMNLLENEQLKQYSYQFQGYMWITGRDWWDFVSFDPRYTEDMQLHVHRLERDDAFIEQVDERYQKFEAIIQGYVDRLLDVKNETKLVAQ